MQNICSFKFSRVVCSPMETLHLVFRVLLLWPNVVETGTVRLFSVTEGIFFIDGFFVRTGQQYSANIEYHGGVLGGTADVAGVFGFDIQRNYVGSNNDVTLLDPARGSYNENAPGADRYQLNLDLNFYVSSDRDDFVPLKTIDSTGNLTPANLLQ